MSAEPRPTDVKRVTTRTIAQLKAQGEKIVCLTAYDYLTAKLLDQAGMDIILVGDSLANVFQGVETTLPVTLDEMIYHAKAVNRAVHRAMVIVDMPFMSYQANIEEGFRNAGRVMKEVGAGGVKFEGGRRIEELVSKSVQAGIPVMGHIGLTPQSIHQFGGYQPRGKTDKEHASLIDDAKSLERAGAFAVVLEKIPLELAKEITSSIRIPTIGIGAGMHCDGQILVISDLLGLTEEFNPRFVRRYAKLGESIRNCASQYAEDVRAGKFPNEEESYE